MLEPSSVPFAREPGRGLPPWARPAYAPMLAAYHRACQGALAKILGALPVPPGARVLDLACGDGTHARLWRARVSPHGGDVVGIDASVGSLHDARAADPTGRYVAADARRLPFPDERFDVVWCAHSLASLPDPTAVLAEARRVLRPGGTIAVLENDTLHHLLLPWPPELELALRRAQWADLADEGPAWPHYAARRLPEVLAEAGFEPTLCTTHTIDWHAPLSADERAFLTLYLTDLAARAASHLAPAERAALAQALDPDDPGALLARPDLRVTHLEVLALGVRPA